MASIVIAEDDERSRTLLTTFLSSAGHEVRSAEDGQGALELIRERPPDLVVTDVTMPRMTGLELIQAIREELRLPGLPVVMLSARTDGDDMLAGFRHGADDYIPKPVTLAVLDAKLKILLARVKGGPLI